MWWVTKQPMEDDDGLQKHFILIVFLLSIFQHMMKGTQWIDYNKTFFVSIYHCCLPFPLPKYDEKEINVRLQNLFFSFIFIIVRLLPLFPSSKIWSTYYFNHQDRYKQKSGEQGNKCYYTKSFQKKKRPKAPHPPLSIAPSTPH